METERNSNKRNPEAQKRAQIAKFLVQSMKDLGLSYKKVAEATGIGVPTLHNMSRSAPQLRILLPIGTYIQEQARIQYHKKVLGSSKKISHMGANKSGLPRSTHNA